GAALPPRADGHHGRSVYARRRDLRADGVEPGARDAGLLPAPRRVRAALAGTADPGGEPVLLSALSALGRLHAATAPSAPARPRRTSRRTNARAARPAPRVPVPRRAGAPRAMAACGGTGRREASRTRTQPSRAATSRVESG